MPDDRTLVITYLSGIPQCFALSRVSVVERERTVDVSVRIGSPAHSRRDICILPGIGSVATVKLDRPVAGRTIRRVGRA